MQVRLLGALEVAVGEEVVDVAGARLQALLARLVLDPGRTVPTGALVEAVWEDALPSDEVHALQSLISRLRRALGDPALVAQVPGGYRLAVAPEDVDAERFETQAREGAALLRSGRAEDAAGVLAAALALWRGPALAGIAGTRTFASLAAARLDELRLAATLDRIEADQARGAAPEALTTELERLATAHPLDERVAALLLGVLHAGGRQADALAAYERVRTALDAELGALPGAELQAAHLAVLRGDVRTAPVLRTNLRAPLTSFVGREPELARLADALAAHRLVTLIGPGGAGKTRLAQTAAARMGTSAPDGVWLVELAPVTEETGIAPALLGALQLREVSLLEQQAKLPAADALARVLDVLADRTALIVLDNCEHLIAAAAGVVDELLGRCPDVRVVATSREPLGIAGEWLVDVPPLAWPADGVTAAGALAHPAVELFADRAAAARPGFAVDDGNVAAVVEVCRRLDGLPLAIELAAARVRTLSPEQLARRLDDRFRLLTGGSRTAMPRHRTLRAVVDWSWDLLDEGERTLAAKLAVFPGGVTPASAAAVDGRPPEDVLDALTVLVDRSLLQVADPDAPRYRMLETIREYGVERLAASGELAAVRDAHARHFAALAEAQEPRLRDGGQIAALRLLGAERENVVAALRHLGDTGDARAALRMATALLWFAVISGNPNDELAWLKVGLGAEGEADPADRAVARLILALADDGPGREADPDVLRALAADLVGADLSARPVLRFLAPVVSWFTGDKEAAAARLEVLAADGDPWVRAAARLIQSQAAENEGEAAGTRTALADALAGFRAIGDRWGQAMARIAQAGLLMLEGDLDEAEEALDDAHELADELGSLSQEAFLEMHLAEIRMRRGDPAGALAHLETARERGSLSGEDEVMLDARRAQTAWRAGEHALARAEATALRARLDTMAPRAGDRGHTRALGLAATGFVALRDGDLDTAARDLAGAYAAATGTGDMPVHALVGIVCADLALARGRATDAAEMLGAASLLRGGADRTNPEVAALSAALTDALGADAFAAAYARGFEADREAAAARLDPASDAAPVGP